VPPDPVDRDLEQVVARLSDVRARREHRVAVATAVKKSSVTIRICGNRPVPPANPGWQNGVNPLTNACRSTSPVSVRIVERLPNGSTAAPLDGVTLVDLPGGRAARRQSSDPPARRTIDPDAPQSHIAAPEW
jgi:hypothetical protein